MSFINEILNMFGEDASPVFRVTILGENAVYIEGVNAIKSYSQEKIELYLKKSELKISGEELFVKKFCAGDIAVCGKIKSVERI